MASWKMAVEVAIPSCASFSRGFGRRSTWEDVLQNQYMNCPRSWFRFINSRNLNALSVQAAITKYIKGEQVLKRQTVPPSSWAWEVRDQSAGKLGSWCEPLPASWTATLLYPHMTESDLFSLPLLKKPLIMSAPPS